MISFLFACVGIIIIACVIRLAIFKTPYNDTIPAILSNEELWLDGDKIKYFYEGEWREAIAKDKHKVYIFDEKNDKIVGIPYVDKR